MSLPISLVAFEARGAVRHTFSPVDDEVSVTEQVHLRAHLHGDAAPALKLVSARGTVRHAAILMQVVEAGRTGHVVVGFSTASQALTMATLPLVRTSKIAVSGTY